MLGRLFRAMGLVIGVSAFTLAPMACGDPKSAGTQLEPFSTSSPQVPILPSVSAAPESNDPVGAPVPDEAAGPSVSSAASERAEEMCIQFAVPRARENGEVLGLTAAYPSTVADFIEWQETPPPEGGPYISDSPYRYGYDPQEFMAYCYVDGEFGGIPMAPKSPGDESPRDAFYRRVGILVFASGEVTLYTAGWPETLSLQHAPGFTLRTSSP